MRRFIIRCFMLVIGVGRGLFTFFYAFDANFVYDFYCFTFRLNLFSSGCGEQQRFCLFLCFDLSTYEIEKIAQTELKILCFNF